MPDFEFRGAEFHAVRMWECAHVIHTLEFMEKYNMTHLIFHMNELLDNLVLPRALYSEQMLWDYWPVPKEKHLNDVAYIHWVCKECEKRNIKFIIECKEIWFREFLLEAKKDLDVKGTDGGICASHPYWPEYMTMRIESLFNDLPDVDGIIVSLGTRESKVSLAANRCKCERCQNLDSVDWYRSIIEAMWKPMSKRGKRLIVRDFAYEPTQLNAIVDACQLVSKDIIISLKNTPHDFYLTFPNNERIGQTGDSPQYIEFDAWGQYFNGGVFPVGVDEDMQYRLQYAKEKGAVGAYFRTDLECIRESSCYNGLSMFNLYAAAMLMENVDLDTDEIYKAWINDGITSPMIPGSFNQVPVVPKATDAWRRFRDMMHTGWSVMEKTLYVKKHLFTKDLQPIHNLWEAWGMMCTIHGIEDWAPGSGEAIRLTDENIEAIIQEKREAQKEVRKISGIIDTPTLGLPSDMANDLEDLIDLFVVYVDMCALDCEAVFMSAKAIETKDPQDIKNAKPYVNKLYEEAKKIKERMSKKIYPPYIDWCFPPKRLIELAEDIEQKLFA